MAETVGIVASRDLIARGALRVGDAVGASFARALASQARLQAFAWLPSVLDVAAVDPRLPLAGIAVAVKDLIDTADMPTTYGSPIYAGHRPAADAWIVKRLRALGAHVLGKSVTTEFAWRHPGPTVNPWEPRHTPGGSSSGSAASVAAGIVGLAIGTQTLGSVIRPASFCGVVGFKPSYGAIPRTGVRALSSSLDHIGIFTRDVADAMYAIELLVARSAADPHGQPFAALESAASVPVRTAPPVIGVLDQPQLGAMDGEQASLMQDVAHQLHERGATMCKLHLPSAFENAAELTALLAAAEAAQHHEMHRTQFRHLLSPAMAALLDQGAAMSASEIEALRASQRALQQGYANWWRSAGIDALLVPPAPGEAPYGLDYTGDARFCSPFTLAGVPAITVPAGFGAHGLPLGMQLVGAAGQDRSLLHVAYWCEQALERQTAIAPGWF